jgi:hypothetical protein
MYAGDRRVKKLPAHFEGPLFAALLSGLMSLLVSGVATWQAMGGGAGFSAQWLQAWLGSWAVAFPAVTVVAPQVRRFVARVVEPRD